MATECPQCESYNADAALHCDQCGAPLGAGGRGGGPGVPSGAVLLVGLVLVALGLWFLFGENGWFGGPTDTGADSGGAPPDPAAGDANAFPLSGEDTLDVDDEGAVDTARPVAGWLEFEDPHGAVIGRLPAAASREGWIAVPRIAALGAGRWVFRPGRTDESPVSDGVWRRGESVGLWRVSPAGLEDAPPLDAWLEGSPVVALPYSGERIEDWPIPLGLRREGPFLRVELDEQFPTGAVFYQEGALVGWATPEPAPMLWLWSDGPGSDIRTETTVEEFYERTFAGGREEALVAAHTLDDAVGSEAARLLAYRDALALRPRLRDHESRPAWKPASAVAPVARTMRTLLDRDAPGAVLDAIDEPLVRTLGDPVIFLLWIDAIAAVDGPEAAIAAIDRLSALLIPPGSDPALEEQLIARLRTRFIEAVALALDTLQVGRAWELLADGRRRFPADPDLALIEVELWIDEADWRNAEAVLSSMVFPARSRDRVALLERRISELRGAEGKVVIRFRPGASSITTYADVAGVRQLFVIDTGASYTSIPWSTVRSLGIRVDADTPRRELRTASDVITAPVVVLPTVTLGGVTVEGVEATVLDLPGSDDVGLLGLNFLGAFRVDLDRAEGTLTLEPR